MENGRMVEASVPKKRTRSKVKNRSAQSSMYTHERKEKKTEGTRRKMKERKD